MKMISKMFCVLSLLTWMGCGYTTQNILPPDVKSIYVPMFKNETFRLSKTKRVFKRGIENQITDAVIREFLEDGSLRVLDKGRAEWILEGTIVSYESSPLRYSQANADLVEEIRISVTVTLTLKDLATGETIWANDTISREEDVYVTGSILDEEDTAVAEIAELIAKDICTQVLEGWY